MSLPSIIAINQTGSPVFLTRLGNEVPASDQLVLTDFASPDEIWWDVSLYNAVASGTLLLALGPSLLTQAQSLRMFGLSKTVVTLPVRAMSISNTTLTGTLTMDGVALVVGDRVLLAGQTDPTESGVWVVQAGAWVRPEDYSDGQSATMLIPVGAEGSIYGNQLWNSSGTVGSAVLITLNTAQDKDLRKVVGLKGLFKAAVSTFYTEYTYTQKNLTQVDVWETSGKTVKLFTRVLTYTQKDLTGVTTTDELTGTTLTQTLVYAGGDLISRSETIT